MQLLVAEFCDNFALNQKGVPPDDYTPDGDFINSVRAIQGAGLLPKKSSDELYNELKNYPFTP